MKLQTVISIGLLGLVGVVAESSASVVVQHRAGSNQTWTTIATPVAGVPITIPWVSSSGDQYYRVYSTNPTSEDIGLITFDPPTELNYQILIGAPLADPNENLPLSIDQNLRFPNACRDLGGFRTSSTQVRLQLGIGRDLVGNIEGFDGGSLAVVRADVGGAVAGVVRHTRYLSQDLELFNASTIAPNGEIRMLSGKLEELELAGDLLGSVVASASTTSDLGDVIVGGDIGTPLNQATVLSRNGIDTIEAQSIYAEVNAKAGLTPLDNATGGRIGILRTLDPTGTFQGTIRATHIDGGGDRYNFAGDVEGLIYIGSSLNTGNGLLKNNRIVINGSLTTSAEIRLPTNGLKGFIIMDNLDSGSTWSGDVVVLGATPPANIVLGPDYPNPSATLGGGSAGTVPFNLHGTDSIPVDGASVGLGAVPGPLSPIRIREYGPIIFGSGTTPVTITAQSEYTGGEVDQTACVIPIPATAHIARDVLDWKTLIITPPATTDFEFLSGYTYRIRPVLSGAAVLNCDIGTPVPVDA